MKKFFMILIGITILSKAFIHDDLLMVTTCVDGYEFVTVSTTNGPRGSVANSAPAHSVQVYESASNMSGTAIPQPKRCGK